MYSVEFAKNYDALMSDYSSLLSAINKLITLTFLDKKSLRVLELGCGTGTILKQFPTTYQLYGLDLSPSMIEIATKKVPNATFFVKDMTHFSLDQKFDLILCVFDSLNHLTKFSQWKKVFKLASKHLDTNGIFLFDINTPKRLQTIATFKPFVKRINKDVIAIQKLSQKNKNVFSLKIDILENINKTPIPLKEEFVDEAAFEVHKVEKALYPYFTIEKMLDPFRARITKNTGRVFFACRKRL